MTPHNFDIIHCQHCKDIIALLAQRGIVHRFKLVCQHCAYENVIYPPKQRIDIVQERVYTEVELVRV